jgi:hypothetical protein
MTSDFDGVGARVEAFGSNTAAGNRSATFLFRKCPMKEGSLHLFDF